MSPVALDTRWPEESLRAIVEEQVLTHPLNRLSRLDGGPIFENPLVGVADGYDPLFAQYKTIIGDFHLTPREVMAKPSAWLEEPAEPVPMERALHESPGVTHASLDRIRVIGWILPIAGATRASNRGQVDRPSIAWGHTRTFGEHFNEALRRHVVEVLREAGYLAVAPVLEPYFRTLSEGPTKPPASVWSERHVMYAAGLGTFGLSDGFITPRGIAMRCGSVVTNLPLEITPRTYASHTANCLYLSEGACGRCAERCPAGAITREGGHDKLKCQAYAYGTLRPLFAAYGVEGERGAAVGCGLCQTGVPCEAEIPTRRTR